METFDTNALMNYKKIIDEAFDAAFIASKKLQLSGEASQPISHGAFGDLTYRIDKDVETAIINVMKTYLPNSLIISEESGFIGDLTGYPFILIDPVDGSTNAFQKVPFYSSAITIIEGYKFSDVVFAGVADLVNNDRILSNEKGQVLFNDNLSHLSSRNSIKDAYISLNMHIKNIDKSEKWLTSIIQNVRHLRFLGSAALETAYVAIGRSDSFIQMNPNLRAFDCIGALYLVKCAGGYIDFLNMDINDIDLRKPERFAYIASNNRKIGNQIMSLKK